MTWEPIPLTDNADLRRMTLESVKICKIKHKVFIEVDKWGTYAAGIGFFKLISLSGYKQYIFRADHPFLYFIRDKTNGIILFSGQLNKR